MKKISFVLGTFLVFGFLFVVSPQVVAAATNITSVKLNGQDQLEVFPGDSVSIAVTVTTTNGDDWESTSHDWISDGNPSICVNTSDETSSGTYTKTFNVSAPNTPGLYDLQIKASGSNSGTNNDCTSVDDTETFEDVLKVKSLGLIKIKKITLPSSGDNFDFTVTGAIETNFSLDDDNNPQLSNEKELKNLQAGSYTVTEGADEEYLLTSIVCDGNAVVNLENRTATINLPASGEARCTFTNELIQLIVQKEIVGGGEGDTPNDFSFVVDKQGIEGPTNHQFEADGGNIITGLDKNGAYDVYENPVEGWITTYSSNRPGDNQYDCDNIDVDSGNGPHICTITNTKLPTLTLEKTVTNDNGGTATEANFQAKIDNNNVAWDTAVVLSAGPHTASEVANVTGYSASSWGGDCAADGSITLAPGQNATCTITNNDIAPKLTVIKHVVNDNNGTAEADNFSLIVNGVNANPAGQFPGSEAGTLVTLSVGPYGVAESIAEGYGVPTFSEDCSGNMALGDEKTCTVTNDDLPPPEQCEEGEQWAYEVVSSNQGKRKDGSNVLVSRTDPESVLGEPDGNGAAGTGFFSLGVNGTITVKFSHFIENVSGDDLYFYEITNGRTTYPEELAKVEVSQDGSTWYDIGTVSSKPTGVGSLDFDSTGLDWIMFVRVTDVTNFGPHSNDADGYDLDAIKAANGLCEEPEEPLSCVPDLNLLANSGFETPDVIHNAGWDVFASGTLGLDWIVDWRSAFVGAPEVANLELHGGVNGWLPNSGSQYAELDTDWGGPNSGQSGEQASVSIYQNVPTILGENYVLSYNFSPRPGANSSENVLEVLIDGVLQNTHSASGAAQTSWTPYSLNFAGTGAPTKIEFRDGGTANSVGTFLDDVSLVCTVDCNETKGTVSSDSDTEVTKVVFNIADPDTTADYSAPLISVVPAIQALGSGVWGANVGDVNAKWIWSNDPYDPDWQVDKWVTFERTFTVDGAPQSGTLNIASDNSYEVWVNGNPVGSDAGENNHSAADIWDVSGYLVDGSNTLEIRVKNWALPNAPQTNNPGGLLFSLSWTAEDCDDPPPPQCEEDEYLNEDNQCVPNEPEPETATISAVKIVCPTEDLLPNWGYGASNITSETAADFLEENESCYLANWTFEWAPDGTSNPGDNLEDAEGAWTEFSSVAPTPALAVVPSGSLVWVREQFDSEYVPFSGDITEPRDQDVSAELYCSNDVLNYDNYDFINPVEAGETYYCVGFNAPAEEIIDVCPYLDGNQTSEESCENDQCESPTIWDSEEQECVTPEVPPQPPSNPPQCSDGIDNDGDDLTDYAGGDPGCENPSDDNETDPFNPTSHPGDFRGGSVLGASTGQVLGQSCGLYMDRFIRFGSTRNDVEQVKLLQAFLNKWMGSNLEINGVYDSATLEVLKAFQTKYADEILVPWNLSGPTGLVYQTTLRWINMLECPDLALSIPTLIEWSKNPDTPKEPLASAPESVPAIQNSNQNEPEDDGDGDEGELDFEDLTASAGEAEEGSNGFINFLKNLFGR